MEVHRFLWQRSIQPAKLLSINCKKSINKSYALPTVQNSNQICNTYTPKTMNFPLPTILSCSNHSFLQALCNQSTRRMPWSLRTQAEDPDYLSIKKLFSPTPLSSWRTTCNGTVAPSSYCSTIRNFHTATAANHHTNRGRNKVLLKPAPSISSTETVLLQPFRTTSSQLRSVQSSRLNTFKHSIGLSNTDHCPKCPLEVARYITGLPAIEGYTAWAAGAKATPGAPSREVAHRKDPPATTTT